MQPYKLHCTYHCALIIHTAVLRSCHVSVDPIGSYYVTVVIINTDYSCVLSGAPLATTIAAGMRFTIQLEMLAVKV